MAKKPPENTEIPESPEEASPGDRANSMAREYYPIKHDKPLIIVEARGGAVVAIYGSKDVARIVLVDWDEFQDEGRPGVDYSLDELSAMPTDTRSLVERALTEADLGSGASPR
jgi:hypothetical protein